MKHLFTSILLLFCVKIGFAQYTEVINSKRPGFSESPYSIGTKVYQVEGGFFYKKISNLLFYDQINEETIEYNSKSLGTDINFRTGQFFERLELNLDFVLENEERNYTRPEVYNESGLGISKLTIGAKYLIFNAIYTDKSKEIRSWKARHSFDVKRLIPSVGIYAGLNTNLLQEMHKNSEGISPKFGIYTQNDISDRFIFIMNFVGDKLFTDEAENTYILTATYTLNEKLSVFAEHQGFFRKKIPNDYQLGGGLAYLLNKNIQIDASFRTILDERDDFTYLIGGGLSWRIDRHQDKIVKAKSNNDETLTNQKKGFFAGIGASIGGIFSGNKSKNSKETNVKEVKVKSRDLTPPVNKKANKARKKQNKELVKQQKKKEKADRKFNKNQKND